MGTRFQSILIEFENDSNRKILGQTFLDEKIVIKKFSSISITNTEFANFKMSTLLAIISRIVLFKTIK